jgi:glycosyltransferase involved in cell wall biosynthesis
LNILFLTPRLPFPLVGGDRVKPYHLLKHLTKRHKVTLVSFYQGKKNPDKFIKELENLGVEVFVVPLNPIKASLSCFFRFPSFKPIEILYYYSKHYKKIVDKLIDERNFDIGFSFFMRTAEYLKKSNIKKVLVAEDSRVLYQSRSFQESKNPLQKLIRYYEFLSLKIYEPSTIHKFDISTFVTDEDISFVKSLVPNTKIKLLTNGTDIAQYFPDEFDQRNTLLFTGKFDVWANRLMAERIIYKIIPQVRKVFPDVKLSFVGANPSKWHKNLAEQKIIELHENVPSMVPYLQKARVYVHPHIGASGIQNKLLEALCTGCPVVTTNSGNQGINGVHGVHLMIGNTDEEIARNIIDLLKNKELSEAISINARKLIIDTHSWERVFDDMDHLIKELTGNE